MGPSRFIPANQDFELAAAGQQNPSTRILRLSLRLSVSEGNRQADCVVGCLHNCLLSHSEVNLSLYIASFVGKKAHIRSKIWQQRRVSPLELWLILQGNSKLGSRFQTSMRNPSGYSL
jgi:hypothetical protein